MFTVEGANIRSSRLDRILVSSTLLGYRYDYEISKIQKEFGLFFSLSYCTPSPSMIVFCQPQAYPQKGVKATPYYPMGEIEKCMKFRNRTMSPLLWIKRLLVSYTTGPK